MAMSLISLSLSLSAKFSCASMNSCVLKTPAISSTHLMPRRPPGTTQVPRSSCTSGGFCSSNSYTKDGQVGMFEGCSGGKARDANTLNTLIKPLQTPTRMRIPQWGAQNKTIDAYRCTTTQAIQWHLQVRPPTSGHLASSRLSPTGHWAAESLTKTTRK